MTKDELEAMLNGGELLREVDVKTLVLDLLKDIPEQEMLEIFWSRLPDMTPDFIRDYFYMKRS